jgi:hypothetical protein
MSLLRLLLRLLLLLLLLLLVRQAHCPRPAAAVAHTGREHHQQQRHSGMLPLSRRHLVYQNDHQSRCPLCSNPSVPRAPLQRRRLP